MAKRRTYKRDRSGRFASTGSTRVKRIRRKINRRRPRYVRGSLGKTLRAAAESWVSLVRVGSCASRGQRDVSTSPIDRVFTTSRFV